MLSIFEKLLETRNGNLILPGMKPCYISTWSVPLQVNTAVTVKRTKTGNPNWTGDKDSYFLK